MRREDRIRLEQYQAKLDLIKEGGVINALESSQEKLERIERAKKDYRFMVEYYFPHYASSRTPDFHVQLANRMKRNGQAKELLRWGRGLAKSVCANVTTPFYLWLNNDIDYMVVVGNNKDKASILLGDLQAEFEANPRIIHDFGEQKLLGSWEDGYFVTKSGFVAKALGMGQSTRGLRFKSKRPDYMVFDDLDDRDTSRNPKRQDEIADWILRDAIPAMDSGNRRAAIANNYFAPSTIQECVRRKRPNWHLHQVDAYDPSTKVPVWPEKYNEDHYLRVEEEIGVLAAQAEYNNKPHTEGKVFKRDQIQWTKPPRIDHFDALVVHWDVAYAGTPTSDFNAMRFWGLKGTDFFNLDTYCKQSKMREALVWLAQLRIKLNKVNVHAHFQYEAQFWNDEVERTIREVEDEYNVELLLVKVDNPRTKKYDRILSTQPYYQNGRVYGDKKKYSHNDTNVAIDQLCGIEPGYKTHDDAPDADEQCFKYLNQFTESRSAMPVVGARSSMREIY